jgi:hypothetical protein
MAAWWTPAPMAVASSRPSPLREASASIVVPVITADDCTISSDSMEILENTGRRKKGAAPSPASIKTNTGSSPSMSSSSSATRLAVWDWQCMPWTVKSNGQKRTSHIAAFGKQGFNRIGSWEYKAQVVETPMLPSAGSTLSLLRASNVLPQQVS